MNNLGKLMDFLDNCFVSKEIDDNKHLIVFNDNIGDKTRGLFRGNGMEVQDHHYAWLSYIFEHVHYQMKDRDIEDLEDLTDSNLQAFFEDYQFDGDSDYIGLINWLKAPNSDYYVNQAIKQEVSSEIWSLLQYGQYLEFQEVLIPCALAVIKGYIKILEA